MLGFNPAHLGLFLCLSVTLINYVKINNVIKFFIILGCLYGTYLTNNRASLLLMLILIFHDSFTKEKMLLYIPSIIVVLILAFSNGLLDSYYSLERIATVILRFEIWFNYLSQFINSNILTGYGYGSSFINASKLGAANAHNQYLDVLYETGISGLIIFLYLIYKFGLSSIKTKDFKIFVLGLLIISFTGEYILPNQSLESWSSLLFLTVGLFNENKRVNSYLQQAATA